jgi:hypothetical protein
MMTPKMDNENIERLIDIIGDGDLTASRCLIRGAETPNIVVVSVASARIPP